MEQKFKIGDVVRLKSFGPYMTVSSNNVSDNKNIAIGCASYEKEDEDEGVFVNVRWQDKEGDMKSATINEDCLVKVDANELQKEIDFITSQKAYQSKALQKQIQDFEYAVAIEKRKRSPIKIPKA